MARYFTSAGAKYLRSTSTPITATPLSMSCWFYYDGIWPDDATLISIAKSTSDNDDHLLFLRDDTYTVSAATRAAGTSSASATSAITENTWQHAGGVWVSDSERHAFLNGGSKGTALQEKIPTGLNRVAIGVMARLTVDEHMDGGLAEAGVWNVALTDIEMALLGAGASPLTVRPQSLVLYMPMFADEDLDWSRGLAFTAYGSPTTMAHPPVFHVPVFFNAPPGPTDLNISPPAAVAGADSVDPTVHFGSMSVSPAATAASADSINPSVLLGSLSSTPAPAEASAVGVDPTVLGGDVEFTPAAVTADADSIDPTVHQGSIDLTPSVSTISAVAVNPSIILGDVSVSPSPSVVVTSTSGPQVIQASLSLSPSAVSANTSKVDPDVILGSISADPDASAAAADSVGPTVHFTGNLNITPSPAVVSCSAVDPAVDDEQNIITTPVTAAVSAVDPSLFWSSQSATPVPASARTLAFIDLEYTPAPVSAGTDVVLPTIHIGDAIIPLYPDAATAGTESIDPTLYFTSFGQTPAPATAGTDSVDPTYYVYGGGYPVVYTSPAVSVPVSVPPTTRQSSLTLYIDLVEAVTDAVDPTLFWTSTSASPSPAVAVASVVAPIAGAFFRYFMEADISLGGWTNELDSSVDIYTSIDEDPADDNDYIQSDWGPDQETYKGKMERMSEPDDDTLHYIEYRYKKENSLRRMDMVVRLRQGVSVIAGWSHDDIGLDFVTQRQLLSELEAALINNYQDLYLEFEAWERS